MPNRQRPLSLLAAFVLAHLVACGGRDDEGLASAAPPATAIPMGAPGAEGAKFEQAALPKPPRPSGIHQKITPNESEPDIPLDPSADPMTPPSPFGVPTTDPTPITPPLKPPPMKTPKGTTI